MAQPKKKGTQKEVKKHRVATSTRGKKTKVTWTFPLEKTNLIYIGIGLAIIILGYLLMATGITEEPAIPVGKWNNPLAVTVAPFILVIGYCIVIPLAIMKIFKTDK